MAIARSIFASLAVAMALLGICGCSSRPILNPAGINTAAQPSTPHVSLLDICVPATHVAYVLDVSSELPQPAQDALTAVRRSIDLLTPAQTFDVFTVAGGIDGTRFSTAPLPATEQSKARFRAALDLAPWTFPGSKVEDTNQAMRLALRSNPDTLYLLINEEFPDNQAAVELLRDAHQKRGLRVHIVVFTPLGMEADPGLVYCVNSITDATGGDSRWLTIVLPER